MYLGNFWGHLKTVCQHRHLVCKYCFKVGLYYQGLVHDLSKFSPCEFINGVRYYQGFRSPCSREAELRGYSLAVLHHFGRNKHHMEYWMDYDPYTKIYGGVKMPIKYIAESICDRIAASETYLKDKYTDQSPLEYYLNSKYDNVVHKETDKIFKHFLTVLAESGKEACFKEIRYYLQNKNKY